MAEDLRSSVLVGKLSKQTSMRVRTYRTVYLFGIKTTVLRPPNGTDHFKLLRKKKEKPVILVLDIEGGIYAIPIFGCMCK